MLEFVVRGGVWNQKTVTVSGTNATNNGGTGDGTMHYRNGISKFGFNNTEKIVIRKFNKLSRL